MTVQVGQEAIDFQVEDIQGNSIKLNDFKDQVVFLGFFRYASCPYGNLRLNRLSTLYPRFKEANLQVLAFFQSPNDSILKYVTGKQ